MIFALLLPLPALAIGWQGLAFSFNLLTDRVAQHRKTAAM